MVCRFWRWNLVNFELSEMFETYSDCRAPWFAGGAWCCTWWWTCSGGGDGGALMCCIWTCWIFWGDTAVVTVRNVWADTSFVLCGFDTGDWAEGFSVTITTPVPLHVVHFVTVVTFFFFAGILCCCTLPCSWITWFWFISLTSNLISPSCDTKICVGREFWALASFWMQVSQRISFGPLRFVLWARCVPQVMHLFLSTFCTCWPMLICSLIVWCSCAGSNESAATIWICPRFWPLSEINCCAWINWPGFCVTTVTVSLCCSSWLCVRLCWLSSVRCGKIWLQTSHLKEMLEIVF